MTTSFGYDIIDNPALGIFWGEQAIETEDKTVPKDHFSIVAVSANTPGSHRELSIDGPQRAVVCEKVFRDTRVDLAIMNEFAQMFVPVWQVSNMYDVFTAPWNTVRPNGHSNGNAEIVASAHSRILDTHIIPFKLNQRPRPIHQIVTLNQHIPTGSLYGVVGEHMPARGDATDSERRALNRILVDTADRLVRAGLPTFSIGDRNGTIGLWPARWEREVSPPDAVMWDGKGIQLRNARPITSVHGKITDHRGFIRVRVTLPTNTLRFTKIPLR